MRKMSRCFSVLVVSAMLTLTACNTVEGVGKDVKSAGDAVEDAAK